MDDQEILRQIDANDLQRHSSIILSQPQKSLVKAAHSGKASGIPSVVQGDNDARFSDPVLTGRLGELYLPHMILLHCNNQRASLIERGPESRSVLVGVCGFADWAGGVAECGCLVGRVRGGLFAAGQWATWAVVGRAAGHREYAGDL